MRLLLGTSCQYCSLSQNEKGKTKHRPPELKILQHSGCSMAARLGLITAIPENACNSIRCAATRFRSIPKQAQHAAQY